MYSNNSSLDAKLKYQQKWNQINWVKVEKFVLRLERSIAKAVEHHCHDNKTLDDNRRYEKELLTKSDWVFI